MNYEYNLEACKTGCPNYGLKWSCPPFSKVYYKLSERYKYAYILVFSTSMDKYVDIKNKYLAIKAANSTLKSEIEKLSRKIEEDQDGYALLSGSCRLCKPCNKKLGKPCKKPDKMRYSMEATYLDVSSISKELLGHELKWYKKNCLPEYTSTVCTILVNNKLNSQIISNLLY